MEGGVRGEDDLLAEEGSGVASHEITPHKPQHQTLPSTSLTSSPSYVKYSNFVRTLQSTLSTSSTPPHLTSHFTSFFTPSKCLSIRAYHASTPSLYTYTLLKELPRLSYTLHIQRPSDQSPSTHTTTSAIRASLTPPPKEGSTQHHIIRCCNQAFLAPVLECLLNSPLTPADSTLVRYRVTECEFTVYLTKERKDMQAEFSISISCHTLQLGGGAFRLTYDPRVPMVRVEVIDCRCRMLFDADIEQGVREAVRDGIMDEHENEGGEREEGGKGVGGFLGNVLGNVVRSAVEGGVRGDEDLLHEEEGKGEASFSSRGASQKVNDVAHLLDKL